MSQLYTRSISDKEIVIKESFLEDTQEQSDADAVMVDKGKTKRKKLCQVCLGSIQAH